MPRPCCTPRTWAGPASTTVCGGDTDHSTESPRSLPQLSRVCAFIVTVLPTYVAVSAGPIVSPASTPGRTANFVESEGPDAGAVTRTQTSPARYPRTTWTLTFP